MSKLLILDGREKLEMWWVEEGYLTDLSSVLLVRACLGPGLHAGQRCYRRSTRCRCVEQGPPYQFPGMPECTLYVLISLCWHTDYKCSGACKDEGVLTVAHLCPCV